MKQFYRDRISEWRWPVLLCIIVWSFWGIVATIMPRAEFTPKYFPCETKPVRRIWIDCTPWYRLTPTGLVPVTTIDRKFYAPLLGIDVTSKENKDEFIRAARFIPIYVFLIGVVAGMTYNLSRKIAFSVPASFVAGLFIGLHKGQLIFFKFMSTIVLPLMVIYGIILLIFWLKYLEYRRKRYLIGYYIFFLLLIGVWEQWVNFLLFFLLYSVLLIYCEKKLDKAIIVNGLVMPLLLFSAYMILKYPTMKTESSNINAEAAYVFSYPTASLMVEDVVVNASLHISDVISPLLFPWPRYSQAVIYDYDMDQYNPFNLSAGGVSKIHYYTLTEWYAAFLFAGFLCLTVKLIIYFKRNEGEIPQGVIGPLLVYTGFAAHLPIMYRVWMTIPPSSELIAYKHYFSILGFSILLGWLVNKISLRIKNPFIKRATVITLCAWLIFSNYQIISIILITAS
jgi:hypothetical protein